MAHFACVDCNELLGGQRYFMKSSKPYCCKCFEKIHIEFCATCGKSIGVEQGQITYEDQHWHATDDCFKCYTCSKSLRGGLMFIPKHGVIYCSNACLKFKSTNNNTINKSICNNNVSISMATPHINGYLPTNSTKLNLIQQQQKQQSPISSPRIKTGTQSNINTVSSHITSPNMNRALIQNQLNSPSGPVSLPISINSNKSSNSQYLDNQQLMATHNNQSRSRKPFNFTNSNDYAELKHQHIIQDVSPQNQHNYSNMKLSHLEENNSFDDLDAVEVINLNQHKLVRSRHSLPDLNLPPEQQQQQQQKKNLKNQNGYYYHDNNQNDQEYNYGENEESKEKYSSQQNLNMQPTSILKRYDSNEKMYPISRPNNNPYTFQDNNTYGCNKNKHTYDMDNNEMNETRQRNIMSSSSSTCIGNTATQGRQTKRVQFANIPPLTGASSVGDLVNNTAYNKRNIDDRNRSHSRSSNGHNHHHNHYSSDKHHHHNHHHRSLRNNNNSHHHHHHHHGSHRRSSSTSNFGNTSTMSSKSHSKRHSRHHNSSRQLSNRSLTLNGNDKIYSDSDYYYDNDKYEYDDDQNTCSTCSSNVSNTTTSTSSTDSESDMDDFGNDILDNYHNFYSKTNSLSNRHNQFDQRSLNRINLNNNTNNTVSNYNRKYNSGLKISYVDNLPLARTNPVLQSTNNKSKNNKKSKSISKFKKDNCTVS